MRLKSLLGRIVTAPLKAVGWVTRPITKPLVEKVIMPNIKDLVIKFLKEAALAAVPSLIAAFEPLHAALTGADTGNIGANWALIGLAALVAGLIRALRRALTWDPEKAGK